MSFEKIDSILEELHLTGLYGDRFHDENLDDGVLALVAEEEHNDLKEELRLVVPSTGHRIAILSAMKKMPKEQKVICLYCPINIQMSWKEFWSHIKIAHQFTANCKNFTCPVCKSNFAWYQSFRKHFQTHCQNLHVFHDNSSKSPADASECKGNAEFEDITEHEDTANDNNGFSNEAILEELERNAAVFIVKLQSSGKIPMSIIFEIIQWTKDLISETSKIAINLASDCAKFKSADEIFKILKNPFRNVESQYKLEKYLVRNGYYIKPEEIVLGTYHSVQHTRKTTQTKLCQDTFQYVPILTLLKKVLQIPGVLQNCFEVSTSAAESTSSYYSSPLCGSHFQKLNSNTSYDVPFPIVYILLFYDEVEISNPLSSRAGMHKLGNCYISILNIDAEFNSKLENIFPCLSFKSKHIEKYTFNKILRPLVDDLKKLESTGVLVETPEYSGLVQIRLGQIIGDNLGIHQLFGLVQSFSANYYCRFCKMSKPQCQVAGKCLPHLARNRNNYNVDLLRKAPSETGIKQETILNELKYFCTAENYCPDILHDVYEGIVLLDLKMGLVTLITTGKLTLEEINIRLLSFNYKNFKSSKPSPIGANKLNSHDNKLGQTASQTMAIISCFTFIFGDCFDSNNAFYQLIHVLLDILEIIMSPIICDGNIPFLQNLIEDRHFLYQILSKSNLKPKHHFITHYGDLIRFVGPLLRYWTMRNEARHRFFKGVANSCGNFRNICKTVMGRNQVFVSYRFLINKPFRPERVHEIGSELRKSEDTDFAQEICNEFGINPEDEICVLQEIIFRERSVALGSILNYTGNNDAPGFIRINMIMQHFMKHYLIGEVLSTEYDAHFRGHKIMNVGKTIIIKAMDATANSDTTPKDGSLAQVTLYVQDQVIQGGTITDAMGEVEVIQVDSEPEKRHRKRKRFFDEESEITDVKKVLKAHDSAMRVPYGEQILLASSSMKPIPPPLRRHLVKVLCGDLIQKSHSNKPSTDQREQLAECIVSQLYPTLVGKERNELKNSYYFPSTVVTDTNTGKKKSVSPTGYIQHYFKNFWRTVRQNGGAQRTVEDAILSNAVSDECDGDEDEIEEMRRWLCNHTAPPQKVFEYLRKTFSLRRKALLHSRADSDFEEFFRNWPRLVDTIGALQQDFQLAYPLVSDNLSSKWNGTAPKILSYFKNMKKSLQPFGIKDGDHCIEDLAFFMLAALFRPKARKITQMDSAKAFLDVINPLEDIDRLAQRSDGTCARIICKGQKEDMNLQEFFVIFESRAMKVETLLAAVDLAFKTYYIFNIPFPNTCSAAWQFLDYFIYDMAQRTPLPPCVSELCAFVSR